MKILCVGGGSGGHITPIVAIIEELQKEFARKNKIVVSREIEKSQNPNSDFSKSKFFENDKNFSREKNSAKNSAKNSNKNSNKNPENLEIRVFVDKKFYEKTREMLQDRAENLKNVQVEKVVSGKFRRYANLNFFYKYFSWYHITKTHLPNLRDFFKVCVGFTQSLKRLKKWRPDAVFCKGGFVCLPVGLAAHFLKIPLVIHDSDTVPGLTNKILAGFATKIGTGSPVENYPNYPREKTEFVGIPVRPEFKKLTKNEKIRAKKSLHFDEKKSLIFVAGGGGGAQFFAEILPKIAPEILAQNAQILLISGKGKSFNPAEKVEENAKNFAEKYAVISSEIEKSQNPNSDFSKLKISQNDKKTLCEKSKKSEKNLEISREKFNEKSNEKLCEKSKKFDKNFIEKNFIVKEFITENYAQILNACDVFLTRAGATSLAEAAAANCATIIIPSPYLSGDHQTKNAKVWEKSGAAVVFAQKDVEKNAEILAEKIRELLRDEKLRENLGENLAKFAKPNALKEMAKMIFDVAEKSRKI